MASDQKNNLESDLQLEEGPLEDSDNYSLDLTTVSTRFYNLQVEETVDQMNNDSAEIVRGAGSLGDRIVFSPGGNEGYLFMATKNDAPEKDVWSNNNQTPREIDDRIFIDEQDVHKTSDAIPSHIPDEAYNSFNSSLLTWSPRSGGQLTDRASSPSAASVTSYQSTCSNMSMTGRRYLEWDYGSDLGPQYQTQGEAAQSLSKLEKLAIGSYSEYLREEPEGREMKGSLKATKQDYLPDSEGEDMRANRFGKFADSLMKQRNLQQQERLRQLRQQKSPALSKEAARITSENTAGDIRQLEEGRLDDESQRSPLKSSSMSDIPAWPSCTPRSRSRSTSAHSLAQLSHSHMSGPSSSSSAGTVVAVQNRVLLPAMFGDLSIISTSPRSLPPHLQDMVVVTGSQQDYNFHVENDTDDGVLEVRQEVSTGSVRLDHRETIASGRKDDNGPEIRELNEEIEADLNREGGTPDTENEKADTSLSTLGDVCPSEQVSQYQHSPPSRPTIAWTQDHPSTSNFQRFPSEFKSTEEEDISLPLPVTRRKQKVRSSEPSSVPTTSDEEVDGQKQPEHVLGANRNYEGDTSTLESVQMVDRAKSFEYIPGSSFQLQENSSSYEYLPGHLVTDNRPPTVLTRRPGSEAAHISSGGSSILQLQGRSRESLHLAQIGAELDTLSAELKEKSEELLARNISQTKQFFKKLKGYIKFISTPSLTVEDSRVKQELAERIMALLSTEESRLALGYSGMDIDRAVSSSSEKEGRKYKKQSRASRVSSAVTTTRTNYTSHSTSTVSKSSALSSYSVHPTERDGTTQSKNHSTESSTRMLKSGESSPVSAEEPSKYICDQRSLSSEVKESDNSARLSDWKQDRTNSEVKYQLKKKREHKNKQVNKENVEIIQKLQEKRLKHMSKMKKEIEKLEELDTRIAKAATGKLSSLSKTSMTSSVVSVESREIKSRTGGLSEDADIYQTISEPSNSNLTLSLKNNPENWALHSRRNIEKNNKNRKDLVTCIQKENFPSPTFHQNKDKRSPNNSSNFGQMFPTPISSDVEESMRRVSTVTTQTIARRVTTLHHSVEIQTDRTVSSETETVYTSRQKIKPDKKSPRKQRNTLPDAVAKQKPVAYYLPMESLSPIRIGRRVLREISGDTENVFYSSENRNILSSYIASLDPHPINKPETQKPPPSKKKVEKLSLQEALVRKRKDFLKASAARIAALHKARDARVLRNAKQAAWLAEVAAQSPRSRMLAEPSFTPVPVVKVFNHRDMIRATRAKFNELPEVQNTRLNTKKNENYRLNRLMAQIYSSRLQRKVVRGTVSLTHHQLVV